jgi:hypothetical protein
MTAVGEILSRHGMESFGRAHTGAAHILDFIRGAKILTPLSNVLAWRGGCQQQTDNSKAYVDVCSRREQGLHLIYSEWELWLSANHAGATQGQGKTR